MELEQAKKLASLIEAAQNIAVVTHMNPDGDALGSSGAMCHYLYALGKNARAVLAEPVPPTLEFIYSGVQTASADSPAAAMPAVDLIICTDFNVLSRAGSLASYVEDCPAPKVLIDHHVGPDTESFNLVFSETETSSASELLFWILMEMCAQNVSSIPAPALYCLMCGMTTDTNNFANSVSPSTFQMANILLGAGVDRNDILYKLYFSYRPNRIAATSYLLSNCLKFLPGGIAYIVITKEVWHRFGLQEGELEGLVNQALSIKEVNCSLTLREDDGFYRVSVRSKKGYSARNLAMEYFHGGGHELASGGRLYFPADIAEPSEVTAYMEKLSI